MLSTKIYIVLFLLLNPLYTLQMSLIRNQKVIKFDKFEVCESHVNEITNRWEYIHVDNTNRGSSILSAKLIMLEEVTKFHVEANIIRCAHKEMLDSCENYITMKVKNGCTIIAQNGSIWTPYVYSFTPPFKCPYRTGTYIQTNGTWDPTLFAFFPLEDWYWKIKMKTFNSVTGKLAHYMCIEGRVINLVG